MKRTVKSDSGRTVVTVEMDELGAGSVIVTVDGSVFSSYFMMKEPGTRYLSDEEKEELERQRVEERAMDDTTLKHISPAELAENIERA